MINNRMKADTRQRRGNNDGRVVLCDARQCNDLLCERHSTEHTPYAACGRYIGYRRSHCNDDEGAG